MQASVLLFLFLIDTTDCFKKYQGHSTWQFLCKLRRQSAILYFSGTIGHTNLFHARPSCKSKQWHVVVWLCIFLPEQSFKSVIRRGNSLDTTVYGFFFFSWFLLHSVCPVAGLHIPVFPVAGTWMYDPLQPQCATLLQLLVQTPALACIHIGTYSPDWDSPAPSNSLPAMVSPLGTHRHTQSLPAGSLASPKWCLRPLGTTEILGAPLGLIWRHLVVSGACRKAQGSPWSTEKHSKGVWVAVENPQSPSKAHRKSFGGHWLQRKAVRGSWVK